MTTLEEYIHRASYDPSFDPMAEFRKLPRERLLELARESAALTTQINQEEQLRFYKPASGEARKIHLSTAKTICTTGGNRSSKTESHLADAIICMTGVVPVSLEKDYPKEKLRCPMRVRLVCNSLTNTWEPVIKPKLQWNKWSGRGEPGGPYGHWGWIPKRFLIKGKWEDSWQEKTRTLTLTCGCTLQTMSYDQDVEDFEGGSFHLVLEDEGPPHAIHRVNLARIMDVSGRIMIAMTPPDEESAAWDAAWVYDEIYEKGLEGPAKDPHIDSFTLFTQDNRILDKNDIELLKKDLSPRQQEVRLKGRFLHLGGRIFPLYSDRPQWWCFGCNDLAIVNKGVCLKCQRNDAVEFQHTIKPFEIAYSWPVVFLLDPHPRKPVMMSWVAIDPSDDWYQIAEMSIDGAPEIVRDKVFDFEEKLHLDICHRIIDPNMGRSPAHNAGRRKVTVADEFAAVGIRCDDRVSDDFTVGKNRVTQMLPPDIRTRRPRLFVFENCHTTNQQFKKWSWDEWTRYSSDMRDPKQRPKEKNDDFPKLFIYLANSNLTFTGLKMAGRPIRRARAGAY